MIIGRSLCEHLLHLGCSVALELLQVCNWLEILPVENSTDLFKAILASFAHLGPSVHPPSKVLLKLGLKNRETSGFLLTFLCFVRTFCSKSKWALCVRFWGDAGQVNKDGDQRVVMEMVSSLNLDSSSGYLIMVSERNVPQQSLKIIVIHNCGQGA